MKDWRHILHRWLPWLASPAIAVDDRESAAVLLYGELQALSDLTCDAATQTLAISKLLERQIDRLTPAEMGRREQLVQEAETLQAEIDHLRTTVTSLQLLRRAAGRQLQLAPLRRECETVNALAAELLPVSELEYLEQAIRTIEGEPAGSGP